MGEAQPRQAAKLHKTAVLRQGDKRSGETGGLAWVELGSGDGTGCVARGTACNKAIKLVFPFLLSNREKHNFQSGRSVHRAHECSGRLPLGRYCAERYGPWQLGGQVYELQGLLGFGLSRGLDEITLPHCPIRAVTLPIAKSRDGQ